MRFFLLILLFCFCISVNLSAQDSTVNPTEAQGQQVVGGTFLSTCQNYGNVSTRTCYDCVNSVPCVVVPCTTASLTAYDSHGLINVASTIDFKFNHIHSATDYNSLVSLGGCNSCGGDDSKQNHLPSLSLKRLHRFRDITEQSSFGPGIFSNYDITLTISADGAGNRIRLFDPEYFYTIVYQDGLYGDTKDGVFYENLRPYDNGLVTKKAEMFTFNL